MLIRYLLAVIAMLCGPSAAMAADLTGVLASFDWIGSNVGSLLDLLAYAVMAATVVTALTPTKADNAALGLVLTVLNFVAGNFFKNTNADALIAEAIKRNGSSPNDMSSKS